MPLRFEQFFPEFTYQVKKYTVCFYSRYKYFFKIAVKAFRFYLPNRRSGLNSNFKTT